MKRKNCFGVPIGQITEKSNLTNEERENVWSNSYGLH